MGSASFLALVARRSFGRLRSAAAAVPDQTLRQEEDDDLHVAAPPPHGLFLGFHFDLAQRLQHLQLHGSGSAHINWLLDALASTLSTHSSLLSALTSTPSPPLPTISSAPYTHLAHPRADDVVIMLDVCSALQQVADDVQLQLRQLQHALQSVGQALVHSSGDHHKLFSSGRIRASARRLSACLNDRPASLLCISRKQYRPLAEAHASLLLAAKRDLPSAATADPAATLLVHAMDGAALTSLLVLASAVASLASPSPRKSSGDAIAAACKVVRKYLGAKSKTAAPWAAPLRQLQRDLRQEEMGAVGGAVFQELQSLHGAAADLHAAITSPAAHLIDLAVVRQSVHCLRKRSREAQACMTTFRMHISSLFQALRSLRLALLDG